MCWGWGAPADFAVAALVPPHVLKPLEDAWFVHTSGTGTRVEHLAKDMK